MASCVSCSILNASRANAIILSWFKPFFSEPIQCNISCKISSYNSLIYNNTNQFIPHYIYINRLTSSYCSIYISSIYYIIINIIRPTVIDCIWISFLRRISSFLTPLKLKCFALKFDFILQTKFRRTDALSERVKKLCWILSWNSTSKDKSYACAVQAKCAISVVICYCAKQWPKPNSAPV